PNDLPGSFHAPENVEKGFPGALSLELQPLHQGVDLQRLARVAQVLQQRTAAGNGALVWRAWAGGPGGSGFLLRQFLSLSLQERGELTDSGGIEYSPPPAKAVIVRGLTVPRWRNW